MKKLVSIITLIMTMMVLSVSAYAFSNEFYSIDVGEGFKEETLNETLILTSTDKDGSINIVMNKTVEGKDYFTQEEIERQKPVVAESEFTVEKAEIQTITSNNYRCIYYESHAKHGEKTIYFKQYLIYSGKYCYAITVTTYKTETADSAKYKNVVDSFKVNDYTGKYGLKDAEKSQENDVGSHVSPGLIGGIVGGIVGGIAAFFIVRSKQNKNGKK